MGFLKGIFEDAVHIAATPARVVAAVVDEIANDNDASETVKDVTEKIKGK